MQLKSVLQSRAIWQCYLFTLLRHRCSLCTLYLLSDELGM